MRTTLLTLCLLGATACAADWPAWRGPRGDGHTPAKGEVYRTPLLAGTLAAVAEGGRGAFYEGDIARRVEKYMRANGGYLTAADFAAQR